tara:strand:+ start:763 stop:1221 length:459 start_codon:yes stop_codon:yes gene_type:complete
MTDIMYSTEWQEYKEKHELHECSCGDTKINHAHEFPELGCYCVTCEHTKETTVMFDEEVIKNLKHIKDIIKDMKTKFDHVRGDVEAREIMSATIDRTIEIIKLKIESKRKNTKMEIIDKIVRFINSYFEVIVVVLFAIVVLHSIIRIITEFF